MQEKIDMLKNFFTKKRILWILGILVLIILFLVFRKDQEELTIADPTFGKLEQTVKATGVVTSKVDLDLSFKKTGTVKSVNFEVGDKVKKGQILATLSAGSEGASVSQARAGVALAEAKLQKIKEGATSEEITLAKVALNNAKTDLNSAKNTQNTLVANAYNKLLNSSLEARSENVNDTRELPTINGTYALGKEGKITVSVYNSGSGLLFSTSGLVTDSGYVNTTNAQKLGDSGLYILFPSTTNLAGANFVIDIPNKKASDYLTNENAYNSAVKTRESALASAESLVAQREAELALKQASARPSEIALGEAEVLSARASLSQAAANYEDTIIRAPEDGTITAVNIKYGEIVDVSKPALVLEDISNLYVEALINEANIKNVILDQKVSIIFDALGKQNVFSGKVSHIDPSSVASDGVVNYKIKVSIEQKDPNIRPGMNAEIVITTFEKEGVLSIPEANLIKKENGSIYVNKITNLKKEKYEEVPVTIGNRGDGNMIEVISGISKEDKIVLPIKK
ncbi:MAG: efflux RND transporter periplasmic adaptor subunit [Candidatus Pacebacteria bacterium]|nr:efflux RND transporter periplasmic adaptor subunit [Candidatus Paceibacterota bacterium]